MFTPSSMSSLEKGSGNTRTTARKPHKKSKTGCIDCRRRRVKCGEERPSCRSCLRRGVSCEYPGQPRVGTHEASDPPVDDSSSVHSPRPSFDCQQKQERRTQNVTGPPLTSDATPGTVSALSNTVTTSATAFGINDMALLHHWTVSTSINIFKVSDVNAFWQIIIPQIAFQHPFVTYAILSLAALHLAYINGTENSPHIMEANRHHNEALRGFRHAVNEITSDNSEALLVWSILNIIYVFGISKQLGDGVERDSPRSLRKDRVLGMEWIPMMRGVEAVLHPTHNYLRFGRMNCIMSVGNWDDLDPDQIRSQPTDDYFRQTRDTWKSCSDAEIYDEALFILRKCRLYIEQFNSMDARTLDQWGCNRAWSGPLMFIYFAPQAYFKLLHQRQPPALILFAYFGALLHGLNEYWFLEGWGRDIVEVVDELLGSYWRPWISWPIEVVELG
ncbi:hypothetical protein DL767_000890 [Monosporascus sp. MG133]|nr:hypothetical protein DL767_000890 [Monosporascus sp. MG133]